MSKKLKTTIAIALIIFFIAGAAVTVILLCIPKGRPRGDIEVLPAENAYSDGSGKNIAECEPEESLFIVAYNVKNAETYKSTVSGEVNAGGIYKQTVAGEKYKSGDEALYVSRATGLFKNSAKQIFIGKGGVAVRSGDPKTGVYSDDAERYTLDGYMSEYGVDFREISNYELNEKTVKSAELVSAEGGVYTYRYEIDVGSAVNGYMVNMYKMGGLKSLPEFKKSTLEIAVTENFLPVYVTQTDEYVATEFIALSCSSKITETFGDINGENVAIPDREFFSAKLDGE